MKKIIKRIACIVALGLFIFNSTIAQITLEELTYIEEEISDILLNETGDEYLVSAYNTDFNSYLYFGFESPDGVFYTGYLFTTWGPLNQDSFDRYAFVGIYENGSIIWQSEKEIPLKIASDTDVLGVLDLTGDGNMEIITQWEYGMRGGNTDLWIYTWDGTSGYRLNDVNEEGGSVIRVKDFSLNLVDFEMDGIKEITGEDRSGVLATYSWNGTRYLNENKSIPDPLPKYFSEVEVGLLIELEENNYRYTYSVYNIPDSKQSLEEFAVRNFANEPNSILKPKNWAFNPHLRFRLVSWDIQHFLEQHREALLEPGELLDTLSFRSDGLPRVARFFALGNNGRLDNKINNLINNSFSGLTLGPWLPDSTLSLESFTDTLETFRFRSCEELGWANDTTVCGQLENQLSQVKTALQNQDSIQAANVLAEFIALVEQEKETSLTSEGYALLFFNSEYLAERLRGED